MSTSFDAFLREVCPHSRESTLATLGEYIEANRERLKRPEFAGEGKPIAPREAFTAIGKPRKTRRTRKTSKPRSNRHA